MSSSSSQPLEIVREINRLWQDRRIRGIAAYLHPGIVMVLPGFAGRIQGVEAILAGFQDYVDNATPLAFSESEHQEDVFGSTAVVSYRFDVTYEREGVRYQGTGWEVWAFENTEEGWKAVWRTMIDLEEYEG